MFGLIDAEPALASSVTGSRVGAAALSLGILREPEQLLVLLIAVVLLVAQGWVINRLAGIPYPVWSARAAV